MEAFECEVVCAVVGIAHVMFVYLIRSSPYIERHLKVTKYLQFEAF